jgi:hypothetical protein
VVTTDKTRRPRDLLCSIKLTAGAVGDAVELKSDREIARDIAHILLIAAHSEKIDPIALNLARRLAPPDADPETWIRNFAKCDGSRDEPRWAEWKAQKGLHRGSSLEGLGQFQLLHGDCRGADER